MTQLLTAAQMQAREKTEIQKGSVTGAGMMERAGAGVVAAVLRHWPHLAQGRHKAVVLCGPGNNGGDGYVIARLLSGQGWQVCLFAFGDPERLPKDARENYDRWRDIGAVQEWDADRLLDLVADPDTCLVVDALFGTGLTRALDSQQFHDLSDAFWARIQIDKRPVVAVDLPSGLCADSGRALGPVCPAALTVSFHAPKLGHYLHDGPLFCGTLVVEDIGLRHQDLRAAADLILGCDAQLHRKSSLQHKYNHGHVLVLSGAAGRTGAARLAARAALRVGAGLVTLGVPESAQLEVAVQETAVMLQRVEDGADMTSALDDPRIGQLVLGPGLGGKRAQQIVPAALRAASRAERACRNYVLDADALSAFVDEPAALFDLLGEHCVITPHGGEFARLFPDLAQQLNAPVLRGPAYSRLDAARDAAARAGCVVLLKGADTIVATPKGGASVHAALYDRAAPWLATAGAGDVLSGLIAGLMAQGMAPQFAAESAAWLHAECARSFGPGLIAEDLPEQLPKVFRDLGY